MQNSCFFACVVLAFRLVARANASSPIGLSATNFGKYPGYAGVLDDVSGAASFGLIRSGAQVLSFQFANVGNCAPVANAKSTACSISILEVASCKDALTTTVPAHKTSVDPWTMVKYTNEQEHTNVWVDTGLGLSELAGKVVIIHDVDGNRAACSPINAVSSSKAKLGTSSFTVYPEYTGSFQKVAGRVTVHQSLSDDITGQILEYDLANVDPKCAKDASVNSLANACGMHVHKGTTCSSHSEVGGHYWSEEDYSDDPWLHVNYVANSEGKAVGITTLIKTGSSNGDVIARSFVVHDHKGTRIACAIVEKAGDAMSADAPWKPSAFLVAALAALAWTKF